MERNLNPTEILNRNYFTSIYFKEPGGVLFEVATELPGFTVDEEVDHLGEELQLPAWFEEQRAQLLTKLPEITIDKSKYL